MPPLWHPQTLKGEFAFFALLIPFVLFSALVLISTNFGPAISPGSTTIHHRWYVIDNAIVAAAAVLWWLVVTYLVRNTRLRVLARQGGGALPGAQSREGYGSNGHAAEGKKLSEKPGAEELRYGVYLIDEDNVKGASEDHRAKFAAANRAPYTNSRKLIWEASPHVFPGSWVMAIRGALGRAKNLGFL